MLDHLAVAVLGLEGLERNLGLAWGCRGKTGWVWNSLSVVQSPVLYT